MLDHCSARKVTGLSRRNLRTVSAGTLTSCPFVSTCVAAPPAAPIRPPITAPFPPPAMAPMIVPTAAPPPTVAAVRLLVPMPRVAVLESGPSC